MRRLAALVLLALAAAAGPAPAQSVAGRYDYYVLALSWSPAYCARAGARDRDPLQCGGVPRGLVVHGLWPQHERGYPRDCPSNLAKAVPAGLVERHLDLMPSRSLIQHEWRAHGLCSGLSQAAYFAAVRSFRAKLRTPPALAPGARAGVTAAQIRQAFVAANPGLPARAVSLQCERDRFTEARVCFTKAGAFRACGGDMRDRCGGSPLTLAARGAP
ncbi:MAG: ribonuclease T [Hyphomonadaceae bacterium]